MFENMDNILKRYPEPKEQPFQKPSQPSVEMNEVEVGEEGELKVTDVRREETTTNIAHEKYEEEGAMEDQETLVKFDQAKEWYDALPQDNRQLVDNAIAQNLRGVGPVEYDSEYRKELILQHEASL